MTARETAPAGRMLAGSGAFRPRVTGFGQLLGQTVVAALVLIAPGLPLPWMSRPQLIVAGVGAGIGAIAWLIRPVWYLFLGQDLARAARRQTDHPPGPAGHAPGPADHTPGRPRLPEGDSDGFINPHA